MIALFSARQIGCKQFPIEKDWKCLHTFTLLQGVDYKVFTCEGTFTHLHIIVSPNSVKACEGAFTRNTLIINMLKCREGVKALYDFKKKEQYGNLNNMPSLIMAQQLCMIWATALHTLCKRSAQLVQTSCTTCAHALHNWNRCYPFNCRISF